MKKRKRDKKLIAIVIIWFSFWFCFFFAIQYIWKLERIDHDEDLLYYVSTAIVDVGNDMYFCEEEESIEAYNSLFDGNVHYLSEIDENTELGRCILKRINTRVYDTVFYEVSTFEEYESKIKTSKSNKTFAMCYESNGYMYIYIPDSYSCPVPFIKGEGIWERTSIRNPNNKYY